YGIGCVAVSESTSADLSIGGLWEDALSMVVTFPRDRFDEDMSTDIANMDFIELVLGDKRWGGKGDLAPYGYRGTAGLVVKLDKHILAAFSAAPSVKVTERGLLKLQIPLAKSREALKALRRCFAKTR